MNNFISVFEELDRLNEAAETDEEKVTVDGVDEVEDDVIEIEDDVIEIEDDEVKVTDEEPVEDPTTEEEDAPSQLVLKCENCGALQIKAEADVDLDEKSNLANIEESCTFCDEADGYEIIGTFMPYADNAAEDVEETADIDVASEDPSDDTSDDTSDDSADDVIEEGIFDGLKRKKALAAVEKVFGMRDLRAIVADPADKFYYCVWVRTPSGNSFSDYEQRNRGKRADEWIENNLLGQHYSRFGSLKTCLKDLEKFFIKRTDDVGQAFLEFEAFVDKLDELIEESPDAVTLVVEAFEEQIKNRHMNNY